MKVLCATEAKATAERDADIIARGVSAVELADSQQSAQSARAQRTVEASVGERA